MGKNNKARQILAKSPISVRACVHTGMCTEPVCVTLYTQAWLSPSEKDLESYVFSKTLATNKLTSRMQINSF